MLRRVWRTTCRLLPVALLGCGRATPPARFTLLSARESGVRFANTITTSDSLNVLTDPYVYNGGGVGVGDIDNDGLPDVFLAGNQVTSRLYRNTGNFHFEDITTNAGVTTHCWATGVTLVDINADGWLDIYVSCSGPPASTPEQRRNLLFVNNHDGTFTESAARYHLDDAGFTAHAVFFDYDGDGDLDAFLLGNSPRDFSRSQMELHPAGLRTHSPGGEDKLYRNNGDGTFSDVSVQAGIRPDAQFGLGVVVSDFNRDGRPDLYVSDDDVAEDVLYVNNGDGTFSDRTRGWLTHTSFAGMGIDAADFNNDGWPDVMQTDMMPEALAARKVTSGVIADNGNLDRRRHRYQGGFTQNTLQLNAGPADSASAPAFSEIARLAGVAYTSWSWSALFGDVDNDGWKDLLVTNGYPKAVTDYDYQTTMFRLRRSEGVQVSPRQLQVLRELPSLAAANYLFHNNGDLTFSNRAGDWGVAQPGFSYGAALADLNNDGTLDLVVNNIDAPAAIYRNTPDSSHYLDVVLLGDAPNTRGLGATLELAAGTTRQFLYHTPYHGYASSMADREHFGLGHTTRADTLTVTWPDGRVQVLTDVAADRVVTLRQADAGPGGAHRPAAPAPRAPFAPSRAVPRYAHHESLLDDLSIQPLLPYEISQHGPVVAVADVDGDGREDVFVGGGADQPDELFLQRADGRFLPAGPEPWSSDARSDTWGALFFDANGDGRPDLYVAHGGYHLSPISRLLQDRLYVNRGGGRFALDSSALPPMLTSTAAVAAGGDLLFVGGRLVPRQYPFPARSYVLKGDGRGHFSDVTAAVAPELAQPFGMVTAAQWVDFDGDGRLDLVIAGEWMGIQFFKNDGVHLRNVTAQLGLPPLAGWWSSLAVGDFNHDGTPDIVAGNFGLNHTFTTSPGRRLGVYAGDFTAGGHTDVLLTAEDGGKEYPLFGLATLGGAIYTLGIKFSTYGAFARADVTAALGAAALRGALHYHVDTFASVYLQNDGHGGFRAFPLPTAAQAAPLRGIVPLDVDGDGNLDLVVAGNLFDTAPNTAPADGGMGLWLRGDGRGHFDPVPARLSGLLAARDVTGLARVTTPAGIAVLVLNSGDSLQAFRIKKSREP